MTPAILLNRWFQLAAGMALALVLGFGLGHHQKTLDDAQAALRGAQKAVQTVKAQNAVSADVGQKTAQAQQAAQTKTITLIREVPRYVTPQADAGCIITSGTVRLLDAERELPAIPDPAGQPVDAPSGVDLSDLAANYLANKGQYEQVSAQLNGLIEWTQRQAKGANH